MLHDRTDEDLTIQFPLKSVRTAKTQDQRTLNDADSNGAGEVRVPTLAWLLF